MSRSTLIDWIQSLLPLDSEQLATLPPQAHLDDDSSLQYAGLEPLLLALHAKLVGNPNEASIWDAVLGAMKKQSVPAPIAEDFAKRGICSSALAHSNVPVTIRHRLAESNRDARMLLGIQLYRDRGVDVPTFMAFVKEYAADWAVLLHLAHETPLELDKAACIAELARSSPERNRILAALDMTYACARARNPQISEAEVLALVQKGDNKVLLALAANPRTPTPLLQEWLSMSGTKHARNIRVAAAANLAARAE